MHMFCHTSAFGDKLLTILLSTLYGVFSLQISYIEKIISEFKERITMLLFSETDDTVLCSMELFQIKIITHEHM